MKKKSKRRSKSVRECSETVKVVGAEKNPNTFDTNQTTERNESPKRKLAFGASLVANKNSKIRDLPSGFF